MNSIMKFKTYFNNMMIIINEAKKANISPKEIQEYAKKIIQKMKNTSAIFPKQIAGKHNRKFYHIRANIGDDRNVEKYFNSLKMNVISSDISLSGTYETYKISIDTPKYKDFWIYFVNTNAGSSSKGNKNYFKTKDLAPDMFSLGGIMFNKTNLFKFINTKLEQMNIPDTAKIQLQYLLEETYKNKSNKIILKNKLNFSKPDLATISKDYGEILGAMYLLNTDYSYIEFPEAINEPFVDIYAYKTKNSNKTLISVKSGSGSATSMRNISDPINSIDISKLNKKEQQLIQGIKAIQEYSITEGVIQASKILNAPFYNLIKNIIKSDFTFQSLREYVDNLSTQEIKIIFNDLYNIKNTNYGNKIRINRTIDENTWNRKDVDKIGYIMGPFTWYLVDYLNSDENLEILSNIVSKVQVIQLNVDVKTSNIQFKIKPFKDSKFKFFWQGGAPNYKRNRVGFKMA